MLALITLLIINTRIFMTMENKNALKVSVDTMPEKSDSGEWTIYGSMGCGWTRKQLDYMKKAGKPHVFVDCDKGGCDGMTAFPTLKGPNGEKIVGYNEV